jgi:hypothetical protein
MKEGLILLKDGASRFDIILTMERRLFDVH